jgi:hypothetical protein
MLFHSIQGAGGFVAAPITPTFVSYAINNATGVSSVTTNAPTNISTGNLLIAVFNANSGASRTLTAPSGWTVVNTTANRFFAHKVATSSEPADYTFTTSGSFSTATCAIMNFSNADIDVFGATSASGSSPSAPSITLAQNNSLVLCVVTVNTTSSNTSVSGFTQIYERTTASAQDVSSKSFNSGATGNVATSTSPVSARSSLIGLKPN